MEPSDARLILFHTSLHYIDTAADLKSWLKIEFAPFTVFALKFCVTMCFQ